MNDDEGNGVHCPNCRQRVHDQVIDNVFYRVIPTVKINKKGEEANEWIEYLRDRLKKLEP
jgi:hypothetical protein